MPAAIRSSRRRRDSRLAARGSAITARPPSAAGDHPRRRRGPAPVAESPELAHARLPVGETHLTRGEVVDDRRDRDRMLVLRQRRRVVVLAHAEREADVVAKRLLQVPRLDSTPNAVEQALEPRESKWTV